MTGKTHHLLHQRHLLRDFVARDLGQKYVGSAGGALWTVAQPLVLLLVYTFVFSVVLRVRFGDEDGVKNFALYLYCGMLPWHAFADAAARATTGVVQHGNLIKNVRFPAKILPTTVVLSELLSEMIGLVLLFAATIFLGAGASWTVVLLPVLVLLQVVFTLGISLLLSAAHVFFRDTEHFVRVGLMMWMFMTPLFYPESRVPEGLRWIIAANPMAYLVRMYRAVLLEGQPFAPADLGAFAAFAAVAFLAGYALFTRNHHRFADLV